MDVVKYYIYEPFGQVLDSGGTFDNPFMFTGQYFDSEIEEYYLRARQYNPHISRFTSRDPVAGKFKEPLTLHRYLYCLNDPVNGVDPSGEMTFTEMKVTVGTWATAFSNWLHQYGARAMALARRLVQGAHNLWIRFNIFAVGVSCWCFTGDTEISTPNGNVPIADIDVGDLVWAYSEERREPTH